jgi:hypothetical protein
LNGNGFTCGDADDISISSTNTTPRNWNGLGVFRISDVTVSYQTGSATINAIDSTSGGNMGANWLFTVCNLFNFDGLLMEGLKVN